MMFLVYQNVCTSFVISHYDLVMTSLSSIYWPASIPIYDLNYRVSGIFLAA